MPEEAFDKIVARRCLIKVDKTPILPEQIMAIFDYASKCRMYMSQTELITQFEAQSHFPVMQMTEYVDKVFDGLIPMMQTHGGTAYIHNYQLDGRLKLLLNCRVGLALVPFKQVMLSVYSKVDFGWYERALRDFALSIDNQIDYVISILSGFEVSTNDDRLRHYIAWHLKRRYIDLSMGNEFMEIRKLQESRKYFIQQLQNEQLGRKV